VVVVVVVGRKGEKSAGVTSVEEAIQTATKASATKTAAAEEGEQNEECCCARLTSRRVWLPNAISLREERGIACFCLKKKLMDPDLSVCVVSGPRRNSSTIDGGAMLGIGIRRQK
jgi:hypothetical protein